MAINLHSKYDSKIKSCFATRSLIAGNLSEEYSFTGVKTVKVTTPITVPMVDYDRTATGNRYGTPTEVQDIVQELTLTQDRSFSLVVDKGNNEDQDGVKAAGKMLALQLAERAIPEFDGYCFKKLSEKAGTIVKNDEALTAENICGRISMGTEALDDAEVPQDGRILYVPSGVYKLLRLSREFMAVESVAEESLLRGVVGMYDNMKVVKVPSARWPKNVNFLIVYKFSATAPVKLNDTKLHQDPPGISGNLIEGRQYYDCFVFAAKAAGVYAEVGAEAELLAEPTFSLAGDTLTITAAEGTVLYTADGSDPRYSMNAKSGGSVTVMKGDVIKACAVKEGAFGSGAVSYEVL